MVAPPGQEVRHAHPPRRALRQAVGLLALRGHGERPLHPAVDHRRDHVRDHAALRPGVRRHVRRQGQGAVGEGGQGGRQAGQGRDRRGGGRRRREGRFRRRRRIPPSRTPSTRRRPEPADPSPSTTTAPRSRSRTACTARWCPCGSSSWSTRSCSTSGAGTTSTGPTLALVLVLVMVAWTAFAVWAYGDARRRRPPLLLADLAVALAMLAATPLVKGDDVQRDAARLLDRGRAAGLGDPLALAGRAGGRRLPLRGRPRDPDRAHAGQLRQRLPDHDRRPARRLPLRLAGHHGRRARPGAAQCRGRRPSGRGWPAPSTTACSRSCRWCSGAAASWAASSPLSARWRGSRSRSCAP